MKRATCPTCNSAATRYIDRPFTLSGDLHLRAPRRCTDCGCRFEPAAGVIVRLAAIAFCVFVVAITLWPTTDNKPLVMTIFDLCLRAGVLWVTFKMLLTILRTPRAGVVRRPRRSRRAPAA